MFKEKGFTLVELMIATVIGVFLVTGIMNLFIATNRTVSLGDALSQNQEIGRFTMDYFTRFVRRAGFSNDPKLSPPELLIPHDHPEFDFSCGAGEPEESACALNNPANTRGDRLSIVYVAGDTTGNSCTGQNINSGDKIADVFWVSGEAGSERELLCRTYSIDASGWLGGAGVGPVTIINNVERFEFQVGIAASSTLKEASRYVSVDNLNEGDANLIRSLRLAVLTTSQDDLDENAVKTKQQKRSYGVLDAIQKDGSDYPLTFEDSNLRSLFITTIELPSSIESAAFN